MSDETSSYSWKAVLERALSDLISGDEKRRDEVVRFYNDLGALVSRFSATANNDAQGDVFPNVRVENLCPLHVYFYSFRIGRPYLHTYGEALKNLALLKKILAYYRHSAVHYKMWEVLSSMFIVFQKKADKEQVKLIPDELRAFLIVSLPTFSEVEVRFMGYSSEELDQVYIVQCLKILNTVNWKSISVKVFKDKLKTFKTSGDVH